MVPVMAPGVVSIIGVVAGAGVTSVVFSVSVVVVSVFFWHPVRRTEPTRAVAAKAASLFLMSFLLLLAGG